jgi:hypothetical protein
MVGKSETGSGSAGGQSGTLREPQMEQFPVRFWKMRLAFSPQTGHNVTGLNGFLNFTLHSLNNGKNIKLIPVTNIIYWMPSTIAA